MSKFSIKLPLGPSAPIGEILLAETAVRIELPPSLHRLAVERYEALRKYIERDASPLVGQVRIFYPQGSMAIRATIRSRKREDGFDIDIVAELTLPPTTTPAAAPRHHAIRPHRRARPAQERNLPRQGRPAAGHAPAP
jgi:hypothetical protein